MWAVNDPSDAVSLNGAARLVVPSEINGQNPRKMKTF
jgi:hypothetical protein